MININNLILFWVKKSMKTNALINCKLIFQHNSELFFFNPPCFHFDTCIFVSLK